LAGKKGDRVAITVTAIRDTVLRFDGPGFDHPLGDSSAFGAGPLVCVELPATDTYRVFAGADWRS